MKDSIIVHPRQMALAIVREDYVAICSGAPDPNCAAVILNLFVYWTDIKLRNRSQAERANLVAEMHGEVGVQDTSLWIWKTNEEIRHEILNLYGKTKTVENIEWLIHTAGYLAQRRNPNPKYAFDKTWQYTVDLRKVQAAIDEWAAQSDRSLPDHYTEFDNADFPNLGEPNPEIGSPTAESGQPLPDFGEAIPESTTENTQEKDSSHAAPDIGETRYGNPGWHLVSAGLESRASEQRVKSQEQKDPKEHTDLERYILATCPRQKSIPETYRKIFNAPVMWIDRKRDGQQGPSPNVLWDTDPDYQRFVKDEIIPELVNRQQLHSKGFSQTLGSAKTYARFFLDYKPRKEADRPIGPKSLAPEPPLGLRPRKEIL